ncbi:hypothetical protein OHV13_29160 [Kitasatospora purpeofusca]|uniref:hypothetical protein n=1 Tax=Kitasatospora purpeofusca TaxID=67352 RepID=UPI003247AC69
MRTTAAVHRQPSLFDDPGPAGPVLGPLTGVRREDAVPKTARSAGPRISVQFRPRGVS